MQPQESIRLYTVYLEQLKEWLSNAEGPDLIEQMGATKENSLVGMAVSFDPLCYYPPVGWMLWFEWVWSSNLPTSPPCLSARY